ncbi:MAG: hypothetical protein ABI995_09330 [Acidobacteriota bacterium]
MKKIRLVATLLTAVFMVASLSAVPWPFPQPDGDGGNIQIVS